MTGPGGKIHQESVKRSVSYKILGPSERFKIVPVKRLVWPPSLSTNKGLKIARIMRHMSVKDDGIGSGIHGRCRPVIPNKIKACIFFSPCTSELSIGNQSLISSQIATGIIGSQTIHFRPIIKGLRASDCNRRSRNRSIRRLRVLEKDPIDTTDWVANRAMPEALNRSNQEEQDRGEKHETSHQRERKLRKPTTCCREP